MARPARPSRIRPQRRRRRRRLQSRRVAGRLHHADRREDLRRLHADRAQPRRPFVQAAQGQCDLQPRPRARQDRGLSLHADAERDDARLFRGPRRRWRRGRSAMRCARWLANPNDGAGGRLHRSQRERGRPDPHPLRADPAVRRPCRQCAAAAGDGDDQLPHLPRRSIPTRSRPSSSGSSPIPKWW